MIAIDAVIRRTIGLASAGIAKGLPRRVRIELFRELGLSLDVDRAFIEGQNGKLYGFLGDKTLFDRFLKHREWNWSYVSLLIKLMGKGGTFFDVGANIGTFAVPIARQPGLSCFAFEPEPRNFELLAQNIFANGVATNVQAMEIALSDCEGQLEMGLSADNFGDHRLNPIATGEDVTDEDRHRRLTRVEARRLDDVMGERALAGPIVMKLDVQGAEPLVLGGGGKTFARLDILLSEFWPAGMRKLGCDPRAYLAALAAIFPYAQILHDAVPDPLVFQPIDEIIRALDPLIGKGGEHHVDILFSKAPTL